MTRLGSWTGETRAESRKTACNTRGAGFTHAPLELLENRRMREKRPRGCTAFVMSENLSRFGLAIFMPLMYPVQDTKHKVWYK
jgi:hypothetical protein